MACQPQWALRPTGLCPGRAVWGPSCACVCLCETRMSTYTCVVCLQPAGHAHVHTCGPHAHHSTPMYPGHWCMHALAHGTHTHTHSVSCRPPTCFVLIRDPPPHLLLAPGLCLQRQAEFLIAADPAGGRRLLAPCQALHWALWRSRLETRELTSTRQSDR